MARKVVVVGAPGLDVFVATVVPGLERVPVDDERKNLTVVTDEDGHTIVVPSSTVTEAMEGHWKNHFGLSEFGGDVIFTKSPNGYFKISADQARLLALAIIRTADQAETEAWNT